MQHIRAIVAIFTLLVGGVASFECAGVTATGPLHRAIAPTSTLGDVMQGTNPGRTGLPFAKDRIFYSLDEYLAFRRELGKTDRPFYEEISPGIYRYVARGLSTEQRKTFTRAELMAEFGFSK